MSEEKKTIELKEENLEKEYLILQDNGTYTGIYFGHKYNAKLYREDGGFIANTTITDYAIMMGEYGISFVQHTSL